MTRLRWWLVRVRAWLLRKPQSCSSDVSGVWISYSCGPWSWWDGDSSLNVVGSIWWESRWTQVDRRTECDPGPKPTLRISEPAREEGAGG